MDPALIARISAAHQRQLAWFGDYEGNSRDPRSRWKMVWVDPCFPASGMSRMLCGLA